MICLVKHPLKTATSLLALVSLAALALGDLFVAAAAEKAPPVFNIVDYGAQRDGSAPATDAFRKAIAAAHTAGGGTVYVPAGK
jgi:polygalacturonase